MSLMSWVAPRLPFFWYDTDFLDFFEKKILKIFKFFFFFFFFLKSQGAPVLLLVWQRLRTLGTFSRNTAHLSLSQKSSPFVQIVHSSTNIWRKIEWRFLIASRSGRKLCLQKIHILPGFIFVPRGCQDLKGWHEMYFILLGARQVRSSGNPPNPNTTNRTYILIL